MNKYIILSLLLMVGCGKQGLTYTYINADVEQSARLDCMFEKLDEIMASKVSSDGTVEVVDYHYIVGMYEIEQADSLTDNLKIKLATGDNVAVQVLGQGLLNRWGYDDIYQQELMERIFYYCK
jgi:hypothetical protein